jgi:V8-like Glu-specific endopeptidase
MKYSRLLICGSVITLACGDFAEGTDESLGSERSEITGGNLVPSDQHGAPDTSAIRIQTPNGFCSGSKVGSNTFWTAGHCMQGLSVGTELLITNNRSGTFSGSQFYAVTILKVDVHPSRANYTDTLGINRPYGIGHFDVARFTVTTNTPNIPSYATTDSAWVDETQSVTYTGYGCDRNDASHSGRKQYAIFDPVTDGELASYTGLTAQFSNDVFHHNIVAIGIPRACPGDSGSPVWKKFGSTWKTVGITVIGDESRDYTGLARYGNVRNWLANPGFNQFTVPFQGFIFNRYTGRCLGGDVVGDAIIARRCDGRFQDTDPQSWRLAPSGGGVAGTFYVVNGKTGKCLDLLSPDSPNSLLVQQTCLPTSDTTGRQRWRFPEMDPPLSFAPFGTYRQLVNVRTGSCAYPANATSETSDGQQVRTGVCPTINGHFQAWTMTR